MQTNTSIRQVKLHSKLRILQRGWTKQQSTTQTIPWLNISGLWLAQAGFHAGNEVQIEVKHHQLIIKTVPADGTTGA